MTYAYRHGVLIGNYNEDKYGIELALKPPRNLSVNPSSYTSQFKWVIREESNPRELKTEVSAKENLPFRILVGHAGYTGRQEDFNRREFTTSNAYFYQDPRCVPVGSITSEKFMLGTEPIFYKDPQKTVLNKKKYTDGFGEGYLKQESTEDMALTSYQRIFKGERVSFIHGNIPPTSAPRIHSHNLSVAHSGYKALGDNHQVGVPLTSAGTSIMSCR